MVWIGPKPVHEAVINAETGELVRWVSHNKDGTVTDLQSIPARRSTEQVMEEAVRGATMDDLELARKMLRWQELTAELDTLELEIKAAVLQRQETFTVANVRATFNSGRRAYDYRAAASGRPEVTPELLDDFSSVSVDWRAVCKHLNIEDVPFTQSEPSITMKRLG